MTVSAIYDVLPNDIYARVASTGVARRVGGLVLQTWLTQHIYGDWGDGYDDYCAEELGGGLQTKSIMFSLQLLCYGQM